MVAAVRDDPARRLELASSFYHDRPGHASIRSYRRAEMAFMRWQVRRGLLAAPDAARPGSAWWRSVNEGLLRDAWEADRLHGFVQDGLPAYAWTNDEHHPWTTTRARSLRSALTWLTSS